MNLIFICDLCDHHSYSKTEFKIHLVRRHLNRQLMMYLRHTRNINPVTPKCNFNGCPRKDLHWNTPKNFLTHMTIKHNLLTPYLHSIHTTLRHYYTTYTTVDHEPTE